jgi:hypothetical protein
MSIRYSEVFPLLAKAVTGFEPDDEDWREPTPYFFLADMIRFVCQKFGTGSDFQATELGACLERLLTEGDSDIRDLVLDGLETLRDQCISSERIAEHFAPRGRELGRSVSSRPESA